MNFDQRSVKRGGETMKPQLNFDNHTVLFYLIYGIK